MAARRILALALAAMAATGAARAQDASSLKKEMPGQWELSTTERSKTCVVTLKSDAAGQGYKLELEPACKTPLPPTAFETRRVIGELSHGFDGHLGLEELSGRSPEEFLVLTQIEIHSFTCLPSW